MEKVFMPFGKLFICPKCGADIDNIEWIGGAFDEPKEGKSGIYEDEYECAQCGCSFIIKFKTEYDGTYIDTK